MKKNTKTHTIKNMYYKKFQRNKIIIWMGRARDTQKSNAQTSSSCFVVHEIEMEMTKNNPHTVLSHTHT